MPRKAALASRVKTQLELDPSAAVDNVNEAIDMEVDEEEESKQLRKDFISETLQKEFDDILKPSKAIPRRSLGNLANLFQKQQKIKTFSAPANYRISKTVIFNCTKPKVVPNEDATTSNNKRKFETQQIQPEKSAKLSPEMLQRAAQNAMKLIKGTKQVTEKAKFAGQTVEIEVDPNKVPKDRLDAALSSLENPQRSLTVMEKSESDWRKHKRENKLDVNTGKKSYVEDEMFLNRVDERVFQTERNNRSVLREFRDSSGNKKK